MIDSGDAEKLEDLAAFGQKRALVERRLNADQAVQGAGLAIFLGHSIKPDHGVKSSLCERALAARDHSGFGTWRS